MCNIYISIYTYVPIYSENLFLKAGSSNMSQIYICIDTYIYTYVCINIYIYDLYIYISISIIYILVYVSRY